MIARCPRRPGSALILAILCLSIFVLVSGTLARVAFLARGQARAEERRLRAAWLAESGLERAWARLAISDGYKGEAWDLPAETLRGRDGAVVLIAVEPIADDPGHLKVTSRADYPREGTSRVRQTRSAVFASKKTPIPGEKP